MHMAILNPRNPSTKSQISDYLADGYAYSDFLDDQTYQCEKCGVRYDDFRDGAMRASDAKWFCTGCIHEAQFYGEDL